MPRQLSETDRAVLAALCRQYIQRRRVPSPATPDEMLEELRANGIKLDVDSLRARLRDLCGEYGVEEDRPDVMRAELVRRLDEDGWIESWTRADDEPGRNPFERLQHFTDRFVTYLQGRGMVVGLTGIAVAGVVAIVLSLLDGSSAPEQKRHGFVIDPDEMTNASGVVKYCVGTDVAGQQQANIDKFNRDFGPSGLTMKRVFIGADATQELETFQASQRDGTDKCDVLYSDVIWTANFVRNGWLVDLSRYRKEVRKDDAFVPTMLNAATVDGRIWGIPKQADAGLLYYRKDRVRHVPRTWQALYKQAQAGRTRRLRYQGLAYEGLTVNFLEIALAAGASNIVTSKENANIDQKPALRALRFMAEGVGRAAPVDVLNQDEERNRAAFERGRADFMRNWPGYKRELLDHNPRLAGKVATAPLPRWRGGGDGVILGGHILVIPKLSKNRGAALKAIDFLSSTETLKRDALKFFLAPTLSELWDDPEVQRALPSYRGLREEVFHAQLRPVVANYEDVSRAIYSNVNRALRGAAEPEDALKLANSQMNEALKAPPSR
jgi:multiple sugar transport system substrate-binding protein